MPRTLDDFSSAVTAGEETAFNRAFDICKRASRKEREEMRDPRGAVGVGKSGEQAAEWWFRQHHWRMFRHVPATLVLPGGGVCHAGGGAGVPDYTGFCSGDMEAYGLPLYRACEIKTTAQDDLPHSALTPAQRAFLAGLPEGCAFVGHFNPRRGTFEIHPFADGPGSYKRGEGIR